MSANIDPDSELMLRVRQGDRQAFAALVDRHKQALVNYIARTIQDPTEAEDLAQHVFVQVFKAAHRYRPQARFAPWLYSIARNACLNELRRRSRHPTTSLEDLHAGEEESAPRPLPDPQTPPPSHQILRAELEAKVAEALRDLPENQRTAILLYQQQQMSYEEIAEVMGCSLVAVKSLIFRGRETLKLRLKAYLASGAWETRDS
ncbi:sigma-70 family RNA polymerase sigma factor [Fontisphaera persica]|uniref:sigma-70 family RNA polymerase sigma factor n=1 Tax=Fontisphaera persica TaxID=2974023 RepID=UPI0024BFA6EB|nr:sigma-70 family RNA polymerase sigma factor [Fontisphaera persica]WCJ60351.1 sigma-70 family RNA polymerase sigma factor [Fontisphaera persica]